MSSHRCVNDIITKFCYGYDNSPDKEDYFKAEWYEEGVRNDRSYLIVWDKYFFIVECGRA